MKYGKLQSMVAALLAIVGTAHAFGQVGTFTKVSNPVIAKGDVTGIIGPSQTSGQPLAYLDYNYVLVTTGASQLVGVNGTTGAYTVYTNPVSTESLQGKVVNGSDKNVYFGTSPHGHLFQLKTASSSSSSALVDLGTPSDHPTYIWSVCAGSDGSIYGGTYPDAHLIKYNATGGLVDEGDVIPSNSGAQYARYVAASPNYPGYVFISTGVNSENIVVYNISARTFSAPLLNATSWPNTNGTPSNGYPQAGIAEVWIGSDGNPYGSATWGSAPGETGTVYFKLTATSATEVSQSGTSGAPAWYTALPQWGGAANTQFMLGSDEWSTTSPSTGSPNTVGVYNNSTHTNVDVVSYAYSGSTMALFTVGIGPDGKVYGGTELPAHLLVNANTGSTTNFSLLGNIGTGETYSYLSYGSNLLIASYDCLSAMLSYNPSDGWNLGTGASNNPIEVGPENSWRPSSMIADTQVPLNAGLIYVGAVAQYGLLSGPLTVLNTNNSPPTITTYTIDSAQAPVSVTMSYNYLVGGTSNQGGDGADPGSNPPAPYIFTWDTTNHEVHATFKPISGANGYPFLVTDSTGHTIWGISDTGTLFSMNVVTGISSLQTWATGLSRVGGLTVDKAGNVWGLLEGNTLFWVETHSGVSGHPLGSVTNLTMPTGVAPSEYTSGLGVDQHYIYFSANTSEAYRYQYQ